jgi:hypothetical protein
MHFTIIDAFLLLASLWTGIWGYYIRRFIAGFDPNETDQRLLQKHHIYSQLKFDKVLLRASLISGLIFLGNLAAKYVEIGN